MHETHDDPPPGYRTRLTIRNVGTGPALVSLDPWHAFEELPPGGLITLSCQVPAGGWIQLDLTLTTVFLNAWRGSGCTYDVVDETGRTRVELLAKPAGLSEPDTSPPEPYATWSSGLEPSSWRALLFAEVPLSINGETHLDHHVSPGDAYEVLVASAGPDDGSVTISLGRSEATVTSTTPLDLVVRS